MHLSKTLLAAVIALLLSPTMEAQPAATTAWRNGAFNVNVANVVGESDIVFGQPNLKATEALPLGNGRLGAAVWSERWSLCDRRVSI